MTIDRIEQSRAGFTSQLLLLIEIYWRLSQSMPSCRARFRAGGYRSAARKSAPALQRRRIRTPPMNPRRPPWTPFGVHVCRTRPVPLLTSPGRPPWSRWQRR